MTQTSGLNALCFELWIRRRKREDTYTLRALSLDVKRAWTSDLERILWEQATHSRGVCWCVCVCFLFKIID